MAAHKYWRFNITQQSAADVSLYITEMEMRATIGGADQCNGGTATHSSAYNASTTGDKAFDNSDSTKWQTAYFQPAGWLAYEFLSPVEVFELVVKVSSSKFPLAFQFEYSDDGTVWTVGYSISGLSWSNSETKIFRILPYFTGTIPNFQVPLGDQLLYAVDHKAFLGNDHFYPDGGNGVYTLNNAPAWMSIDSNTGLLQGTPNTENTDTGISITYTTASGAATSNTFSVEPVVGSNGSHKHWRVYITTETASDITLYYKEIEMRAIAGGVDQCNGGIARANSTYSPNYPSNAFDNNINTQWAGAYFQTIPRWISYEFASQVEVLELVKSVWGPRFPLAFQLEYSDDDTNWFNVFEISGLSWSTYETKTFTIDTPLPPAKTIFVGCQGKA